MKRAHVTRREFLERSGLLFLGLAGASSTGLLTGCESHSEVPKISGGLRRFVTPIGGELGDQFYARFGNPELSPERHPVLAPEDWSLAITGAVATPVTLTYADVVADAETDGITFLKTMRCILDSPGLPFVSNGYWRGVPLGPLLAQARPTAGAVRVRVTTEDGWTTNLRLARILDDVGDGVPADTRLLPVVLAFELNGVPIPSLHGGPVRLVVPEKFGYKNAKYPRELEVTESDEPFGYYESDPGLFDEPRPLTDDGNIAITSFFSGPNEGEAVLGPGVSFFGVAVNGPSGIDRVEVSVDEGAFEAAEVIPLSEVLADPVLFFGEDNADRRAELEALREVLVQAVDPSFGEEPASVWALWRYSIRMSRGQHEAHVRALALDGSAQVETDTVADDGDSRIRRVRFEVR